jgi:protein ImuB
LYLLPQDQRPGQPLHQFIERVASKLGAQAVRRPLTRADHRPEAAQDWVDALQEASIHPPALLNVSMSAPHHFAMRPAWLLAQPLPLLVRQERPYYQGALTLMHGPERLESSVLVDAQQAVAQRMNRQSAKPSPGAIARDYFVAWSAHAGLLWIYRERAKEHAAWFLHGLYA